MTPLVQVSAASMPTGVASAPTGGYTLPDAKFEQQLTPQRNQSQAYEGIEAAIATMKDEVLKTAKWHSAEMCGSQGTMSEQLEALRQEDPATVFIVRHIHKLGFGSADILREYFANYGEVKDVFVSHSRVKTFKTRGRRHVGVVGNGRMRAAGLGFVMMGSVEVAARILCEGTGHVVNGVHVILHPFTPHEAVEDELPEPCLKNDGKHKTHNVRDVAKTAQVRYHSPGSDTSNRAPQRTRDYAPKHQGQLPRMQQEATDWNDGYNVNRGPGR